MSDLLRHSHGCDARRAAEKAGEVADSLDVRMALLEAVKNGEMTMEQAQSELARIKRAAKRNGKITRSQAYKRGAR